MKYTELKDKQHKEFEAFPIGFAFSKKQFAEAMEKLGLTEADTGKVYSISGGGFIRKTDSKAFGDMLTRLSAEMAEAMKDDEFMIGAIEYELGNHEYCITFDPEDTVNELSLNMEDERTTRLFSIAKHKYLGGLTNEHY